MISRKLLLLVPLALAACAETDPYSRPGMWRPTGANEANLRVMLANPSDYVSPQTARGADGNRSAMAVERYRRDRTKPLPDSNASRIAPQANGQQGAAPQMGGE